MARHRRDYSGEKRTAFVGFQLTPDERATLESGAAGAGTTLSQHAREMCLRRSAAAQIVAGTRRNPHSDELVKQLIAAGNNLNQLAKVANTNNAAPQIEELTRTTDQLKAAIARVLAL